MGNERRDGKGWFLALLLIAACVVVGLRLIRGAPGPVVLARAVPASEKRVEGVVIRFKPLAIGEEVDYVLTRRQTTAHEKGRDGVETMARCTHRRVSHTNQRVTFHEVRSVPVGSMTLPPAALPALSVPYEWGAFDGGAAVLDEHGKSVPAEVASSVLLFGLVSDGVDGKLPERPLAKGPVPELRAVGAALFEDVMQEDKPERIDARLDELRDDGTALFTLSATKSVRESGFDVTIDAYAEFVVRIADGRTVRSRTTTTVTVREVGADGQATKMEVELTTRVVPR